MKLTNIILLVLLFATALPFQASAQNYKVHSETLSKDYDSLYQVKSVRMDHTFWGGPKLLINDDTYSLKYMSDIGRPYKSVMAEYKNYQSSNRIKNISLAATFILYCVAYVPLSKENPSNSDYTISLSLLAGSLITAIVGGVNEVAEVNHMEKSIWHYNREIMRSNIFIPDTLNQ